MASWMCSHCARMCSHCASALSRSASTPRRQKLCTHIFCHRGCARTARGCVRTARGRARVVRAHLDDRKCASTFSVVEVCSRCARARSHYGRASSRSARTFYVCAHKICACFFSGVNRALETRLELIIIIYETSV